MASLVLGPLLRYVGADCAVFWVETDEPCDVAVLSGSARTFHVEGHHYGLVRAKGLEPCAWHEYEVSLDGSKVWPPEDSDLPPSHFHTLGDQPDSGGDDLRVAFGSCRVCVPNEPPYTLRKDEDDRGREVDAARTMALRMIDRDREEWPDLLLLLGDQVYADEVSPRTREFIDSRRDTSQEPGEDVWDFEEYTRLYRESWGDPVIRWLLSCVPSAMIFDDHDVHDDWNISADWLEEMRATGWWDEHVVGALMSYWIYQHLGNLSPDEHDEYELLARVREADDAGPLLRDFCFRADRESKGSRWSYHRDLGRTRLVVIDSRAGRVLEPGRRSMLDEAERQWVADHATGGFDHLLIASSLPWLLAPGMHYLEGWNEATCEGAWGRLAARRAEKLRQGYDLEHWAAFQGSFHRLAELQRAVAAGERGEPPASIVTLGGDVHHAYLYEVAFPRGSGVRSRVFQAVCSPVRNPLDAREKRAIKAMATKPAIALTRALARAAGVPDPPVRWRSVGGGPWFDNQVATLVIEGRRCEMHLEKAVRGDDGDARLEHVLEHTIA